MRTTVFSLLPLLLSLLAGCGKQAVPPVTGDQTAQDSELAASSNAAGGTEAGEETRKIADPKKQEPHLWSDRDAVGALKALGYVDAFVYRWRNGAVEASVLFDSDDEQERWDFRSTEIATARGMLDTPLSSGVFVVALTRQSDGVYECRTGATVRFDDQSDTGSVTYREVGETRLSAGSTVRFSSGRDGRNSAYWAKGGGENEVKFVKISFSPVSDEQ